MPAAHGGVSENLEEYVEQLVEDGVYEDKSDAYSNLIRYGAAMKHGYEGR